MNDKQAPLLFVSHHSSQLGVAQHVEKALNARGIRCWIAPRDVEPGTSFARAIPAAISESSAVLLLFCSSSVKSVHVERELILADQLTKAIIPLRLERIDPGELSYHLASSQWIDWLEQRDASIDRIAARAFDLHERNAASEPPPPADIWDEKETRQIYSAPPPPPETPAQWNHAPAPSGESPPQWNRAPGEGGEPQPQWGWSPGPGGAAPPPQPAPSRSKMPWLVLGGFLVLALIAVIVAVSNSGSSPSGTDTAGTGTVTPAPATTPAAGTTADPAPAAVVPDTGNLDADVVTEEWFAGVWSDSQGCEETYRFEAGGVLVIPDGSRGVWSIENGDTLVVSGSAGTERSKITRVSDNEVMSNDGPAYRCTGTGAAL